MGPPHAALKDVFSGAADLPAGPQRDAYLDRACPAGSPLRERVEALLRALDAAGRFLDSSPGTAGSPGPAATATEGNPTPDARTPDPAATHPDTAAGAPRPSEGPGSRIGPYTLLRLLGEGGMGVVYVAEQTVPVRRTAALKVIKPGMDTGAVIARFEAERQALALTDHPNIAKVLDAGTTPAGRPYFVMELVRGVPINRYADDARLTLRQRLELFVPVCQAIQHAHQKGIIHRDIKPSNVLVTEVDGKPVPKVIDFGIAKAVVPRPTGRTIFTHHGALVGTPEYMSPEQAGASPDVDTRTDVYSLGVLLYELLTGTTPLDRETLRRAALEEVLRRVKDEEPPRPSTRLSGTNERLPSVAAVSSTEPARLAKLVRGDLDRVVMKALEKDRGRRYETASGLARDVRRFLEGDPVEAGPVSRAYRLRKFARKHRVALTTAGAFLSLLVSATGVSSWAAWRAARAEALAETRLAETRKAQQATQAALAQSEAAREQAGTARAEARDEADKVKAINSFLINDLIGQAEPARNAVENRVTLAEVLDRAASKIGDRFRDRPEVEQALRLTIAQAYHGLASWEKNEAQLRDLLALSLRHDGPDALPSLIARRNLGHCLYDRGRMAEARENLAAAATGLEKKLGPGHAETLIARDELAMVYNATGRTAEAISLMESSLAIRERTLGAENPVTLIVLNNLAVIYRDAGRDEEAVPLFEKALRRKEAMLGPDHPLTINSRNNLAFSYLDAGRIEESIRIQEENVRLARARLGPDHFETLNCRNNLGAAYVAAGRVREGMALHQAVLEARQAILGPDHPGTLYAQGSLAHAYETLACWSRAEPLRREVLDRQRTANPTNPPALADALAGLGRNLLHQGRPAEAEPLLREALVIRSRARPDAWDTFDARCQLGAALADLGRPADAEPLLVSGYEGLKSREKMIRLAAKPRLAEAAARIVHLYESWGKPEEAKAWKAKLGLDDLPTDAFAPTR